MERQDRPSQETKEKWHIDPNNWIWGMFYYNKDDKRLLPPKRIAWMGWTVNFANRNSVLLFVFALLLILTFVYLVELKK